VSGFPTIPSRDALGPEFEDATPVLNPKKHVSGDQLNLWAWQIAGSGLCVPKAWVVVNADGTRVAAGASWNPNGDPSLHPTTSRTSAGLYLVTWAATYENEKDVSTQITLYAGKVSPQGSTANLVGVPELSGPACTVRITAASSGTPTDAKFLLEVR
jgi:hypothetical protein